MHLTPPSVLLKLVPWNNLLFIRAEAETMGLPDLLSFSLRLSHFVGMSYQRGLLLFT